MNVTVLVLTLMGLSEEPGFLEGLRSDRRGDGPADRGRVPSFTRILVRPEAGAVLLVGRDRYMVPEDPKRFLRVWDKTCRFPGCNRSAANCDIELHRGGGLREWTSPTGRRLVSEPARVIRSASTEPSTSWCATMPRS